MKHFTILSGTVLVVELPEGATNIRVDKGYIKYDNSSFNDVIPPVHLSQKHGGIWELLGPLTSIPEEVAAGLVTVKRTIIGEVYKDYETGKWDAFDARESLLSAIRAAGYYIGDNPYKFPHTTDPEFYDEPYDGKGFYQELYGHAYKNWYEAEERVISPERTWLFKIKEA